MSMVSHVTQLVQTLSSGPYDDLYAACSDNILWGANPSNLVQQFLADTKGCRFVLDAGCGDGANALALEVNGCTVVGTDISALALRGLKNRFAREGRRPKGTYLNVDIDRFVSATNLQFDCIVSCGLFHCLPSKTRVRNHRALLQRYLRPGGTFLFSCLTDMIPLIEEHRTLGLFLAGRDEIGALFDGLEMAYSTQGIIDDSHPLVPIHTHSVFWAMATRI